MRRALLLACVTVSMALVACGARQQPATSDPAPQPSADPAAGGSSGSDPGAAAAANAGGTSAAASSMQDLRAASCEKNVDCVLSTFSECCACCRSVPKGFQRAALEQAEARCASVRCAPCEEACGPDPNLALYTAQCVDRRCAAVPH